MSRRTRSQRGSMFILIVCTTAVVFVPLIILLTVWGPHCIKSARAKDVVEGAGKIAAMDLSRIVIQDPNFGYVSLSNYTAVGKATCALDGEPLPVMGINTVVATLRQNAIIAQQIRNDTMIELVNKDCVAVNNTITELNGRFKDALANNIRRGKCRDIQGIEVSPVHDVTSFLSDNLPATMQIESVNLTLGWLDGGSETGVAIPKPARMALVSTAEMQSGQYDAFCNYPIAGNSFSFAGVGAQAHLVPASRFRDDDGKHICSIVKIECNLVSQVEPRSKVQCVACCQAYSHEDKSTSGAMTLRFSGRPVPGLLSWNEFLSNGSYNDNRVTTFDVLNGDFPFDKEARMCQRNEDCSTGTASQFAQHFYYWLRNGRLKPRVDAVLSMLNEPLQTYPNQVHKYEFMADGYIATSVIDGSHFARSVVADGQVSSMADTRVRSGASAIIIFRDNVAHLGPNAGKHGGAPLAGYPLGGSDSSLDYKELASTFCQRANNSTGLALDIEIGGTNDSTASRDVISMRDRTRTRRI